MAPSDQGGSILFEALELLRFLLRSRRQRNAKRGAFSKHRFNRNRAAMCLDDGFGYRQPQAR